MSRWEVVASCTLSPHFPGLQLHDIWSLGWVVRVGELKEEDHLCFALVSRLSIWLDTSSSEVEKAHMSQIFAPPIVSRPSCHIFDLLEPDPEP